MNNIVNFFVFYKHDDDTSKHCLAFAQSGHLQQKMDLQRLLTLPGCYCGALRAFYLCDLCSCLFVRQHGLQSGVFCSSIYFRDTEEYGILPDTGAICHDSP